MHLRARLDSHSANDRGALALQLLRLAQSLDGLVKFGQFVQLVDLLPVRIRLERVQRRELALDNLRNAVVQLFLRGRRLGRYPHDEEALRLLRNRVGAQRIGNVVVRVEG